MDEHHCNKRQQLGGEDANSSRVVHSFRSLVVVATADCGTGDDPSEDWSGPGTAESTAFDCAWTADRVALLPFSDAETAGHEAQGSDGMR